MIQQPTHMSAFTVWTDLPISPICPKTLESRLCISLIILLIPYLYIAYLYFRALMVMHNKDLFKLLDKLDLTMVSLSALRILALFAMLIFNVEDVLVLLAILRLAWLQCLLFIFLRFVMEDSRSWKILTIGLEVAYFGLCIALNFPSNSKPEHSLYIPIRWPSIFINIVMLVIAIVQFQQIRAAFNQPNLPSNIAIELRNRRSFIFQSVVSCWTTLVLTIYKETFEETFGDVLFFMLVEWAQIFMIYRNILYPFVVHDGEESEVNEEAKARVSNLIVIEMQEKENRRDEKGKNKNRER